MTQYQVVTDWHPVNSDDGAAIVYDTITFRGFDQLRNPINWSMTGAYTSDLMAGLLSSIYIVCAKFNIEFVIEVFLQGHVRVRTSNNDSVVVQLNDYILYQQRTRDQLLKITGPTDQYGWWILDPTVEPTYDLYIFKRMEFIQGFITGCQTFKVDFRDYIAGSPFRQNIFFNIEGYDIEPISQIRGHMAVGAFFNNLIHEGLTDDFE